VVMLHVRDRTVQFSTVLKVLLGAVVVTAAFERSRLFQMHPIYELLSVWCTRMDPDGECRLKRAENSEWGV